MWLYNGKEIYSHDDLLPECTAFVYEITYVDGRKYLGQKTVKSIRRKKPTKAQLDKRKNYVRKEWVNLPFVNYEGSLDKSECPEILSKEILYQCKGKKAATYLETALLFEYNAIIKDTHLNKNILGKFFDCDLVGLLE